MIKKIATTALMMFVLFSCSNDNEPDVPAILSSDNTITSFKLTINGEVLNGVIDQLNKTISFELAGAELKGLKPLIEYSDKARISPSENESQNFNNEVAYTVYAENGTSSVYRVIVNNRPLSTENDIISFSVQIANDTIDAEINQDSNIIDFNTGSQDKSALIPTISISQYATISPDPSIAQNFEHPVTYTVTSENGVQKVYVIFANMPKLRDQSTAFYYIRATMMISGQFISPDEAGAEFFLFDGLNKYPLPILKTENYNSEERVTYFNIYTKIPENVPTFNNYRLVYKTNSTEIKSNYFIDVVAENAPKFISLNQEEYDRNDILIITGENISETIVIPSNGSLFLIRNSNNYDYTVNTDKTEASLTLNYSYLFPSYFGNPPSEKTITFWGPNRRVGESKTTIFN